MKTKAIYPEQVLQRGNEVLEGLREAGYLEQDAEINNSLLLENLCKFFLDKFMAGDDLIITEDECDEIYIKTGINTSLDSLIEKGLFDSIEDENGEEIFFMTEKGKQLQNGI
jgi:hypothetical protein